MLAVLLVLGPLINEICKRAMITYQEVKDPPVTVPSNHKL